MEYKYILAIDPGPEKSGYIFLSLNMHNSFKIIDKEHIYNYNIFNIILNKCAIYGKIEVVIETIVTYGNTMSQDTIDTAIFAGRFYQFSNDLKLKTTFIKRPDVQLNLCKTTRAKRSNMKQAIKDRFGEFGTKKNPQRLYKLKERLEKGKIEHLWSALELGITYVDINFGECK